MLMKVRCTVQSVNNSFGSSGHEKYACVAVELVCIRLDSMALGFSIPLPPSIMLDFKEAGLGFIVDKKVKRKMGWYTGL